MDLEIAKKTYPDLTIFASGSVPSGYFGDRENVLFALKGNTIVTVSYCGYFRTGMPDVKDEKEAFWLLERHPVCRNIRNIRWV